MPKAIVFTQTEIIEAAFDIFKQEGMPGISARKIAAKLNSSTAPVYTSFNNIEEIKKVLLEKSLQVLITYTEQDYTSDIFLNIGVGMLEFAKDYGIIYRTLFIENNDHQYILKEFTAKNLQQMKKEKGMQVFSEAELQSILEKLTIFTHGMASFICAGMLKETSQAYLVEILENVGGDVIGATALRNGKLEELMKYHRNGGEKHEKNHHN